jgi:scyllo-inositol 2-dehydrogenase (NAD+)
MLGFSFRYHPVIRKLRELVGNELGEPRMLAGRYVFDWLPPAEGWMWDPDNGNGFFNENSCHLFDAVCSLMGRPSRVFCESGRLENRPMADSGVVTMRFESGAIASLTVGGIGTNGLDDYPRIDLFAADGQAALLGHDHVWQSLSWADATGTHSFTQSPERIAETRYSDAFSHFFDCIRENRTPETDVEAGVLAVEIAMAVTESARTDRPVSLEKGTT